MIGVVCDGPPSGREVGLPARKKRKGYIAPGRRRAYDALRKRGYSKTKSARIANAGRTKARRKAMARKSARTRKRRRR